MPLFVVTYDVRAKNHDYNALYALLNSWSAAHLQDSVWLADMNGTAAQVRDAMMASMHKDDTTLRDSAAGIWSQLGYNARSSRGECVAKCALPLR